MGEGCDTVLTAGVGLGSGHIDGRPVVSGGGWYPQSQLGTGGRFGFDVWVCKINLGGSPNLIPSVGLMPAVAGVCGSRRCDRGGELQLAVLQRRRSRTGDYVTGFMCACGWFWWQRTHPRERLSGEPAVVRSVAESYLERRVERVMVGGIKGWVRSYGEGRAAGIEELCGCALQP